MLLLYFLQQVFSANPVDLKGVFSGVREDIYLSSEDLTQMPYKARVSLMRERKEKILEDRCVRLRLEQRNQIKQSVHDEFQLDIDKIVGDTNFAFEEYEALIIKVSPKDGTSTITQSVSSTASPTPGFFSSILSFSRAITRRFRIRPEKVELISLCFKELSTHYEKLRPIEKKIEEYYSLLKDNSNYREVFILEEKYIKKKEKLPNYLQDKIEENLLKAHDTIDTTILKKIEEALNSTWPIYIREPEWENFSSKLKIHPRFQSLNAEEQSEVFKITRHIFNQSLGGKLLCFYSKKSRTGKTSTVQMILESLGVSKFSDSLAGDRKVFESEKEIANHSDKWLNGKVAWILESSSSSKTLILFLDAISLDEARPLLRQLEGIKYVKCPYFPSDSERIDIDRVTVFITSDQNIVKELGYPMHTSMCLSDSKRDNSRYYKRLINDFLSKLPTPEELWPIWEVKDYINFIRFITPHATEDELIQVGLQFLDNEYFLKDVAEQIKGSAEGYVENFEENIETTSDLASAYAFLGRSYCSGRFVKADKDKAEKYFISAIGNGREDVVFDLWKIHPSECAGTASEFLKKEAEKGCPDAQYHLAQVIEVSKKEEAIDLYREAAKKNEPRAKAYLKKHKLFSEPDLEKTDSDVPLENYPPMIQKSASLLQIQPALTEFNLNGNCEIGNWRFENLILKGTKNRPVTLTFHNCTFVNIIFRDLILRNADFQGSYFEGVWFDNVDFISPDFTKLGNIPTYKIFSIEKNCKLEGEMVDPRFRDRFWSERVKFINNHRIDK